MTNWDWDFIGDIIICALIEMMGLYWVYGTVTGIAGGSASRSGYYESAAR